MSAIPFTLYQEIMNDIAPADTTAGWSKRDTTIRDPFDEIVCDAIIANSGVKNRQKVQNVCDDGCIKHGSDFSCVCDSGHTVQFN